MSTAATAKSTPAKAKKDKEKEKEKKEKAPPTAERLKTVVRRLPPNLPEEVFWNSVSTWVKDETINWKSFCPGKLAKRINKENVPSRAYIAFKTEELVLEFSRGYDGHIFRDKAGHESQAIVEFAPFQKIPTEKKKVDARMGTIEKDEDFISFLAALNAESSAEPVSLESLVAANQPAPQPKTTPLLEALKAEKAAAKEKEAIQRNHAHYKDGQVTILAPRKDDKKKGAQAQKAPEPAPPTSKKAQKKAVAAAKAASSSNQNANQKASTSGSAPAGAKADANSKSNAGPSNAPAKSPKPSKKERQKAAAAAKANAINGAAAPAAPASTTAAANPPPSTAPAPASASAQPAASADATPSAPAPARRSRPLIGIGRTLEAALSGAGVSADRKASRRVRESEKAASGDAPASTSAAATASGSAPASTEAKARPTSPKSPRRDRTAKPSIIPDNFARIDDPSTQPTNVSTTEDAKAAGGSGNNNSRGSRRGRGRGRGGNAPRGAAPTPT